MTHEIAVKSQQINIEFDGIDRDFIARFLKRIKVLQNIKIPTSDEFHGGCLHVRKYGISVDTFHSICRDIFKVKPDYQYGRWGFTLIHKVDGKNDIYIDISSESVALAYDKPHHQ